MTTLRRMPYNGWAIYGTVFLVTGTLCIAAWLVMLLQGKLSENPLEAVLLPGVALVCLLVGCLLTLRVFHRIEIDGSEVRLMMGNRVLRCWRSEDIRTVFTSEVRLNRKGARYTLLFLSTRTEEQVERFQLRSGMGSNMMLGHLPPEEGVWVTYSYDKLEKAQKALPHLAFCHD